MKTCCVCGQQSNCHSIKSTCSNNVLDYCVNCIRQGYENYDELVNYGFTFDTFNNKFREVVVIPTLRYYNKTKEQFNADVESRKETKYGQQA